MLILLLKFSEWPKMYARYWTSRHLFLLHSLLVPDTSEEMYWWKIYSNLMSFNQAKAINMNIESIQKDILWNAICRTLSIDSKVSSRLTFFQIGTLTFVLDKSKKVDTICILQMNINIVHRFSAGVAMAMVSWESTTKIPPLSFLSQFHHWKML